MNNREVILNNLEQARSLMLDTLTKLMDENTDGNQFDYVNSPKLSDSFDALERTVSRIERIIYQKD